VCYIEEIRQQEGEQSTMTRKSTEEFVQNMQRKAKTWLEAEAGLLETLQEYRGGWEKRLEDAVSKVTDNLPVATRGEVAALEKQVQTLGRKVNGLTRKLKDLSQAA
jgi:polyhydroxyalkanoate synthesis regulator phasin